MLVGIVSEPKAFVPHFFVSTFAHAVGQTIVELCVMPHSLYARVHYPATHNIGLQTHIIFYVTYAFLLFSAKLRTIKAINKKELG